MPAERGDRKPCVHAGCAGMMQFGRKAPSDRRDASGEVRPSVERNAPLAWRCSETAAHTQSDSER